jgi:hypothetical protein
LGGFSSAQAIAASRTDPVFDFQFRHASKFSHVVRDENSIQGQSMGRNQKIHGFDGSTSSKPLPFFGRVILDMIGEVLAEMFAL